MKLITNNKIYVEMKDLIFIGNLPNFVIEEINQNENGFEVFKNPRSIDYFMNKNEIIDYSLVKSLSEEEIYDLIHNIHKQYYDLEFKNNRGIHTKLKLEKYEYMVRTLKEYIDYKKLVDKKYNGVSKGELEWQIKKNLLKKD